ASVGRSLHQHRNLKPGKPQRVGHSALVAEIGQGDYDSINFSRMFFEQLGAARGFRISLHRAVSRTTALAPAASTAAIISSRPVFARWSGKNPRFPTTTPYVIVCCAVMVTLLVPF